MVGFQWELCGLRANLLNHVDKQARRTGVNVPPQVSLLFKVSGKGVYHTASTAATLLASPGFCANSIDVSYLHQSTILL